MAADIYAELLKRAQDELSPEEQHRLADALAQSATRSKSSQQYKITDLKGLGKLLPSSGPNIR
jgi:hypothetical protein